jgi:hypothetical protein
VAVQRKGSVPAIRGESESSAGAFQVDAGLGAGRPSRVTLKCRNSTVSVLGPTNLAALADATAAAMASSESSGKTSTAIIRPAGDTASSMRARRRSSSRAVIARLRCVVNDQVKAAVRQIERYGLLVFDQHRNHKARSLRVLPLELQKPLVNGSHETGFFGLEGCCSIQLSYGRLAGGGAVYAIHDSA